MTELKARIEAERAGQPFLLFRGGDERQQLFFLAPGLSQVSVGRRSSADVALEWDEEVSRLHARFERIDDDWTVVDDGLSRNGTFVNGERLAGRRRLRDGDRLTFGATAATFLVPARVADVTLSTTQRRVLVALCRPYKGPGGVASPAADAEIAEELFLSVAEVTAHLHVLCVKLGVDALPAGEQREALVERAFAAGLVSERDL